jgi:hypothetical protein
LAEWDRQNRTARTRQPEQEGQKKTAVIARIRQPEKDSQIGKPEEESQYGSARTG